MSNDGTVTNRYDTAVPTPIIQEFHELSKNPPGNDPYMKAFYQAATELSDTNLPFRNFIQGILKKREDIDPKHFANLFCRSTQYIELYVKDTPGYPHGFDDKNVWKDELEDIITNDNPDLERLLLTKSTTTTVYQRYAGAATIMTALFPDKPLHVTDFGCGGNYGLRGIDIEAPFDPIEDNSEGYRVSNLLAHPPKLASSIAIDLENPDDPETKKWRRACLYTQELTNAAKIDRFEDSIKQSNNVNFMQADLRELPIGNDQNQISEESQDVVIISTLCYQMPEQQKSILGQARKILKPDGIIIIQDFAQTDSSNPNGLDFDVNWFGQPYAYRNFVLSQKTDWTMKEILRWKNGRCASVIPGKDFDFITSTSPQAA